MDLVARLAPGCWDSSRPQSALSGRDCMLSGDPGWPPATLDRESIQRRHSGSSRRSCSRHHYRHDLALVVLRHQLLGSARGLGHCHSPDGCGPRVDDHEDCDSTGGDVENILIRVALRKRRRAVLQLACHLPRLPLPGSQDPTCPHIRVAQGTTGRLGSKRRLMALNYRAFTGLDSVHTT